MTNLKIKVSFIAHSANLGGAERSLLELLDILTEAKLITPYIILPAKGPMEELLKQRDIPYKIISFEGWVSVKHPITTQYFRTIRTYFKAKQIAKQIQAWGCNIVFSNTLTISVGAFAAKRLKLPHIWEFREYGLEHHGVTFDLGLKRACEFIQEFSAVILANSKGVQEKFNQLLNKKEVQLIHNPILINDMVTVSKDIKKHFDEKSFNLVVLGFVQPSKKQEDAILAVQKSLDEGHQISLTIVGGLIDEYFHYLISLIKPEYLHKNILFTGNVSNPLEYILAGDAMVFCSQFESYPRVVIEAFRLQRPVIAANSGGVKEQIIDGKTGLLYPPGNIDVLSKKILELMDDKAMRKALAKNAYSWVSTTCTKDKFLVFFKSLFENLT